MTPLGPLTSRSLGLLLPDWRMVAVAVVPVVLLLLLAARDVVLRPTSVSRAWWAPASLVAALLIWPIVSWDGDVPWLFGVRARWILRTLAGVLTVQAGLIAATRWLRPEGRRGPLLPWRGGGVWMGLGALAVIIGAPDVALRWAGLGAATVLIGLALHRDGSERLDRGRGMAADALLLASSSAVLAAIVGTVADPSWPLEGEIWGVLAGGALWGVGLARVSGARWAWVAVLGLATPVGLGWALVEDRVPDVRLPAYVDVAGRSGQPHLLRGRRFCSQVLLSEEASAVAEDRRVRGYDRLGFAEVPAVWFVRPCTVLADPDLPATVLPPTGTYVLATDRGGWVDFDPGNIIAPPLDILQHPDGVVVSSGGRRSAVAPLEQLPSLLPPPGPVGRKVRVRSTGAHPWTIQQALSICLTAENAGLSPCHLR